MCARFTVRRFVWLLFLVGCATNLMGSANAKVVAAMGKKKQKGSPAEKKTTQTNCIDIKNLWECNFKRGHLVSRILCTLVFTLQCLHARL
mmetsp:Transcript_17132/g.32006  ORF Transcript_17132/g.32006 Transcript_17132/m.32006 type:complete len:90 (+) Transcript_17132:98-367(+)